MVPIFRKQRKFKIWGNALQGNENALQHITNKPPEGTHLCETRFAFQFKAAHHQSPTPFTVQCGVADLINRKKMKNAPIIGVNIRITHDGKHGRYGTCAAFQKQSKQTENSAEQTKRRLEWFCDDVKMFGWMKGNINTSKTTFSQCQVSLLQ